MSYDSASRTLRFDMPTILNTTTESFGVKLTVTLANPASMTRQLEFIILVKAPKVVESSSESQSTNTEGTLSEDSQSDFVFDWEERTQAQ